MPDTTTHTDGSRDGTARAHGPEDGRVMDLLNASGVLNPNATLDTLMDVTRQLAELEPGITGFATQTFYGSWYLYKQIVR
jgi:hypothetical protein